MYHRNQCGKDFFINFFLIRLDRLIKLHFYILQSSPCPIMLAIDRPDNYVAEGVLHAIGGTGISLHNRPLQEGVVKVSIEKALQPNAPVPCPQDGIEYVKDALGAFIAWPYKWMTMDMEVSI